MPVSAHDCIVVGAGPAGAWASRCLASSGFDTLILDRRPEALDDDGTATVLSPAALRLLPPLEGDLVDAWVRRFRLDAGHRSYRGELAPRDAVALVPRARLLTTLRRMARKAGARYRPDCRALGFDLDDAGLVVETTDGGFRASVVVGADGADGIIARSIRAEASGEGVVARFPSAASFVPATARDDGAGERPGERRAGTVEIDLGVVPGGVAWWIAAAGSVVAGAWSKTDDAAAVRDGLGALLARHGIDPDSDDAGVELAACPAPRFRPDEPLQASRFLLVGGAAGLVDPLTGEGMRWALESAGLASRAVQHHLRRNAPLEAYGEAVRAVCYPDLLHAGKLATAFHAFPGLAHRIVTGLPLVDRRLQDLVAGRLTYEDLFRAYASRPAFRLLLLAARLWPGRG